MGPLMLIVIAGACVGLGFLLILLTTQRLNSEITELTQRIKELERELLHEEKEQSQSEDQHVKQGDSGDETVHPSPRR
jgi:Tfp pilus assembly protein PilN